jgi:uncharacterized lipoprotein YmbA
MTCLLLALAGCSFVPEAQSDPTRFYVLSADGTRSDLRPNAPLVFLRDVELASYLRSRPLVVRRGENEIEFREFSRWGEPLELGIARVLREELVARGAASGVRAAGARRDSLAHDLVLNVRVLACEGGANGSVIFRAVWDLSSTSGTPGLVARGEYRASGLRWDGKSEASLVGQLSQAVVGLAGEIAAALEKK